MSRLIVRNKSGSRVAFMSLLVLLLVPVFGACESTDEGGEGERFVFEAECRGNGLWLVKKDTKYDLIKEEGPAQVPPGKTCDEVEDYESGGLARLNRTGEWKVYFTESTALNWEGPYVDGKRQGVWKNYTSDGKLLKSVTYANDKLNGQEIVYFPGTQEWKERGDNVNALRSGRWEIRHALNSDCISSGSFHEGYKSGEWEECSRNEETGKWFVSFKGNYSSGLRDGPVKLFHPNGELLGEGNYYADSACLANPPQGERENCGKRFGSWKIFFPDGNLAMEGQYSRETGKRSGTWTEYYQTGEKMSSGNREHTRMGWWTFWEKNGQVAARFRFDGNDFSPVEWEQYENGRMVGKGEVAAGLVQFDVKTDSLKITWPRQNGMWTVYGPGGAKIAEGEMVMGKKNGEWKELSGGSWRTNCYMIGMERPCN